MRLEMDRAVSAYSGANGTDSGYDNAKLLADEVTSITFRYWNGTEWASEWNSDDMGGLPLAIEVVMTMADANAVAPASTTNFAATTDGSTDATYRIVVHLPTASLPPPAEEPSTEEIAPAMGSASAGTGATSTGAAGSSGGSSAYGTGSSIGAKK